jgi:type I restriction-modification system DNA methylase subunit
VFTPKDVAEMMARMQFNREHFESLVRENGIVSVVDPAVGSGALLLGFAKVVHDELGRWGVNRLRLHGTDIDARCVLMCRIQMRMNGLDAFGRLAGSLAAYPERSATVSGETENQAYAAQTAIPHGGEWQEEDSRIGTQPVLR